MSKNNLLKKSDKKFIRLEKSRIRKQFYDSKKQEELINELYKRFLKKPKTEDKVKDPSSHSPLSKTSDGQSKALEGQSKKTEIKVKPKAKKKEVKKPKTASNNKKS